MHRTPEAITSIIRKKGWKLRPVPEIGNKKPWPAEDVLKLKEGCQIGLDLKGINDLLPNYSRRAISRKIKRLELEKTV